MVLNIVNLKRMAYKPAYELQLKLLEMRQQGMLADTLLLVEHPPVITLGRRGVYSNILLPLGELEKIGVEIFEIERGGDVTYHGPGQIVGYPIIDLGGHGRDIKSYVWNMEEVFIRLLDEEFSIKASREEKKYTGVWVGNEKITAIGIAVKHWVTMHGFAFNVNTDLSHFKWINPCGITDKGVTSLQKLLGVPQDYERMTSLVARYFAEIYGYESREANIEDLTGGL